MHTISVKHWKADQSLHTEVISRREDGAVFRAELRRNSHNDQSYARAYAWTAQGWSFVTSTPVDELRMSAYSYATKDEAWKDAAAMDAFILIEEAEDIVPFATSTINKLDTEALNSLSEEIKNYFPEGISISSDMKFTRDQIAIFVRNWKGAN